VRDAVSDAVSPRIAALSGGPQPVSTATGYSAKPRPDCCSQHRSRRSLHWWHQFEPELLARISHGRWDLPEGLCEPCSWLHHRCPGPGELRGRHWSTLRRIRPITASGAAPNLSDTAVGSTRGTSRQPPRCLLFEVKPDCGRGSDDRSSWNGEPTDCKRGRDRPSHLPVVANVCASS